MKCLSHFLIFFILQFLCSCEQPKAKKNATKTQAINSPKKEIAKISKKEKTTPLTDKSAIPFFYKYNKQHKESIVKVKTRLGDFEIELFKDVPYHRSNFIYLVKQGYFDNTCFHRVVRDFIIQGGNCDNHSVSKKRHKLGKYILPLDTKNKYKHHRGAVSIPASNIDNPHKLASPYEFFIVVHKPGAYHLDEKYTVFGKVIKGMDVVDKISNLKTDRADWPIHNVNMKMEIIK